MELNLPQLDELSFDTAKQKKSCTLKLPKRGGVCWVFKYYSVVVSTQNEQLCVSALLEETHRRGKDFW